jgi:hypothetical protein
MTGLAEAVTARSVQPFRTTLSRHRWLAAAILFAALALRLLVPAGYMPVLDAGRATLAICSGQGPVTVPTPAHHAMAGMAHHGGVGHDEAVVPKGCAFADLSLQVLGGADPVLLAVALAFILAIAIQIRTPAPPRAAPHLRPPLRGPPLPR